MPGLFRVPALVDELLVDELLVDELLVDELLVDELLVDELLVDELLVDDAPTHTYTLAEPRGSPPRSPPATITAPPTWST